METCTTLNALGQSKKKNNLVSGPVSAEPASGPAAVEAVLLSKVQCLW